MQFNTIGKILDNDIKRQQISDLTNLNQIYQESYHRGLNSGLDKNTARQCAEKHVEYQRSVYSVGLKAEIDASNDTAVFITEMCESILSLLNLVSEERQVLIRKAISAHSDILTDIANQCWYESQKTNGVESLLLLAVSDLCRAASACCIPFIYASKAASRLYVVSLGYELDKIGNQVPIGTNLCYFG